MMEVNVNAGVSSLENSVEDSFSERRLWTAVLVSAVQDWRVGPLRAKRAAQDFLFQNDRDFKEVCAGAGIDPENFRSKLMKIGRQIEMHGPLTRPLAA
jgi:hypothetical protein